MDFVKVKQNLPIMQEYLGQRNRGDIKLRGVVKICCEI